mgnify:FL=1
MVRSLMGRGTLVVVRLKGDMGRGYMVRSLMGRGDMYRGIWRIGDMDMCML